VSNDDSKGDEEYGMVRSINDVRSCSNLGEKIEMLVDKRKLKSSTVRSVIFLRFLVIAASSSASAVARVQYHWK
jgi:hypothetical protein